MSHLAKKVCPIEPLCVTLFGIYVIEIACTATGMSLLLYLTFTNLRLSTDQAQMCLTSKYNTCYGSTSEADESPLQIVVLACQILYSC